MRSYETIGDLKDKIEKCLKKENYKLTFKNGE